MDKDKYTIIVEETLLGLRPDEIQTKYGFSLGSIYYQLVKSGLDYKRGKKEETKTKYSNRMKSRHANGDSSGEGHWSFGKMKVRGKFVAELDIKEELQYYLDQDLTLKQISELMDIDPKSVTNRLRKFGMQKGLRKGNRHPDWRGGHSKYRGEDWYSCRQNVLIRDNYSCQVCGIHRDELENPQHLHVHHIVPYEISQNNNQVNLITLCNVHHMEMEKSSGRFSLQYKV